MFPGALFFVLSFSLRSFFFIPTKSAKWIRFAKFYWIRRFFFHYCLYSQNCSHKKRCKCCKLFYFHLNARWVEKFSQFCSVRNLYAFSFYILLPFGILVHWGDFFFLAYTLTRVLRRRMENRLKQSNFYTRSRFYFTPKCLIER